MYHNKAAIEQFFRVALGECVLTALMLGVYALVSKFTKGVLLAAIFGSVAAILNFLALSVTVSRAADMAEAGKPERAKLLVQGSSVLRLLVLGAVYVAVLWTGALEPLPAILPVLFIQISINVMEYFRKDGDGSK